MAYSGIVTCGQLLTGRALETIGEDMNSFNAVFWDYPKFTDPAYLRKVIQKNKG